jgi:hypothetical protein
VFSIDAEDTIAFSPVIWEHRLTYADEIQLQKHAGTLGRPCVWLISPRCCATSRR